MTLQAPTRAPARTQWSLRELSIPPARHTLGGLPLSVDTGRHLCNSGLWPQLHDLQGSLTPASATPGLEGLGLGKAPLTLLWQRCVLLSLGPHAPLMPHLSRFMLSQRQSLAMMSI